MTTGGVWIVDPKTGKKIAGKIGPNGTAEPIATPSKKKPSKKTAKKVKE